MRKALDEGSMIGVIAIDLSKAFDCMPHGLLLAKLSAYGFDTSSCELMQSYIRNRQQRVKIGETMSDWVNNIKGVPQGSILGPLLFNVFINDFLFLNMNSKIYNYADDNTLCCTESDISVLKDKLCNDCVIAMHWFESNSMKANASKFQLMFMSRYNKEILKNNSLTVQGSEIKSSHSIDVLGVNIDMDLKLTLHVDNVCSQTGKQINCLKRIKHHLDIKTKQLIYNTYVASNFNYCSIIWMLSSKTNMEKLERTNKRALRFVTNKYHLSYEEICNQEKQLSVYRRCLKNAAILMYKIKKGISPKYVSELFSVHQVQYDMRDNDRMSLPNYNTITFGKNSFSYIGAKLWNNIPVEIKRSVSLNTFKSSVTKWLLTHENDPLS